MGEFRLLAICQALTLAGVCVERAKGSLNQFIYPVHKSREVLQSIDKDPANLGYDNATAFHGIAMLRYQCMYASRMDHIIHWWNDDRQPVLEWSWPDSSFHNNSRLNRVSNQDAGLVHTRIT
jgi:hypothetical protein